MAEAKKTVVIGTRSSKLAMIQAQIVSTYLKAVGFKVKVEPIATTGDKVKGSLAEHGGKGLFVKELEEALIQKRIDVAVHSMKDVPALIGPGLAIAAVTKREDPRDVMVSTVARSLNDLPGGARVATSSPRRRIQILGERSDLTVVPMRGNIDTRFKKLKDGEAEAIIVAAAGLIRLRIAKSVTQYLPPEIFIPSVGQGSLAVEVRQDETRFAKLVQKLCHDLPTAQALKAERSFLRGVGGDCHTPVGAYATLEGSSMKLIAFLATPDGSKSLRDEISGDAASAVDLGKRLADQMTAKLQGKSIGRRV